MSFLSPFTFLFRLFGFYFIFFSHHKNLIPRKLPQVLQDVTETYTTFEYKADRVPVPRLARTDKVLTLADALVDSSVDISVDSSVDISEQRKANETARGDNVTGVVSNESGNISEVVINLNVDDKRRNRVRSVSVCRQRHMNQVSSIMRVVVTLRKGE